MAEIRFKEFVQSGWSGEDSEYPAQKRVRRFYGALAAGRGKKGLETLLFKMGACNEGDVFKPEDWKNLLALRTLAETSFGPPPDQPAAKY